MFEPAVSPPLILPWIVLNPAGNAANENCGKPFPFVRRGAAWTMAVMSWKWGFSGFITYNLFPFEHGDPKEIKEPIRRRARDILASYKKIASDIAQFDSAILAWGSELKRETDEFAPRLMEQIALMRPSPLIKWRIGQTATGYPFHPSRKRHDSRPERIPENGGGAGVRLTQ
ncbi:DUF1643 domain-containing protein [Allomesorhizobium alhagi]|nr:DUF1643 domain-containing protein [Mesorhizobium alhagi]